VSADWWDDLTHPDDAPTTRPASFVVRMCSRCGREKRGDNLAIVNLRSGGKEYRCVHCHRVRQRKHDRARAAARAS
jgi:hypothetical protein